MKKSIQWLFFYCFKHHTNAISYDGFAAYVLAMYFDYSLECCFDIGLYLLRWETEAQAENLSGSHIWQSAKLRFTTSVWFLSLHLGLSTGSSVMLLAWAAMTSLEGRTESTPLRNRMIFMISHSWPLPHYNLLWSLLERLIKLIVLFCTQGRYKVMSMRPCAGAKGSAQSGRQSGWRSQLGSFRADRRHICSPPFMIDPHHLYP